MERLTSNQGSKDGSDNNCDKYCFVIVAHIMGDMEGRKEINIPHTDYDDRIAIVDKIIFDWEASLDAENYISAYARRILHEIFGTMTG